MPFTSTISHSLKGIRVLNNYSIHKIPKTSRHLNVALKIICGYVLPAGGTLTNAVGIGIASGLLGGALIGVPIVVLNPLIGIPVAVLGGVIAVAIVTIPITVLGATASIGTVILRQRAEESQGSLTSLIADYTKINTLNVDLKDIQKKTRKDMIWGIGVAILANATFICAPSANANLVSNFRVWRTCQDMRNVIRADKEKKTIAYWKVPIVYKNFPNHPSLKNVCLSSYQTYLQSLIKPAVDSILSEIMDDENKKGIKKKLEENDEHFLKLLAFAMLLEELEHLGVAPSVPSARQANLTAVSSDYNQLTEDQKSDLKQAFIENGVKNVKREKDGKPYKDPKKPESIQDNLWTNLYVLIDSMADTQLPEHARVTPPNHNFYNQAIKAALKDY